MIDWNNSMIKTKKYKEITVPDKTIEYTDLNNFANVFFLLSLSNFQKSNTCNIQIVNFVNLTLEKFKYDIFTVGWYKSVLQKTLNIFPHSKALI